MAKQIPEPEDVAADELPDPETYNAMEDETMEEYNSRLDEEESRWRGKQGGRGAAKHDANEHRPVAAKLAFNLDESWDPNMGNL